MKKKKLLALILSVVLVATLCVGTFGTVFGDESVETQSTSEEITETQEEVEESAEETTEANEKTTEVKKGDSKSNKTASDLKTEDDDSIAYQDDMDGNIHWSIDEEGALVIRPKDNKQAATLNIDYVSDEKTGIPWEKYASDIKTAEIEEGVAAGESLSHLFAGDENLTSVEFNDFDTTETTNMKSMFEGCTKLKDLDLSSFNTKNVTKAKDMLYGIGTGVTTHIKLVLGEKFFNMSDDALDDVNLSCDDVTYTVKKSGDKETKPTGTEYSEGTVPLSDIDKAVTLIGKNKTPYLNFDANGGKFDDDETLVSVEITLGEKIDPEDIPIPTWDSEHYAFKWYSDKECKNEFSYYEAITQDMLDTLTDNTIYSGWSPDPYYYLVYKGNGGFYNGTNKAYVYGGEYLGTDVIASSEMPSPTKEGYRFSGKYYKEDTCENEFKFDKSLKDNYSTLSEGFYYIYAGWIKTYTVTFVSNGGTDVDSQTVDTGTKATKPTDPKWNGTGKYKFMGWYTDPACTQKFSFKTKITEDTELYAKWKEIKTYTVNYYLNGGVLGTSVTNAGTSTSGTTGEYTITFGGSYIEGETITVAGTTTRLDSTMAADSTNTLVAAAVAKTINDSNGAFTASVSGNVLTLKGNASQPNDVNASVASSNISVAAVSNYVAGTSSSGTTYASGATNYMIPLSVDEGDKATNLTVTKTGYTFGGWYTDSTYTTKYDFSKPVTGSFNLYAKWTLSNGNNGVNTGDHSNATLWIIVIVAVVVVAGGSIIFVKKRSK